MNKVNPASAPAKESPSDVSNENNEGPVWRLNNTNWYVIASSVEIVLLMSRFSLVMCIEHLNFVLIIGVLAGIVNR